MRKEALFIESPASAAPNVALLVINKDVLFLHYVELLEGVRVLGILYVSEMPKDLRTKEARDELFYGLDFTALKDSQRRVLIAKAVCGV